MSQSQKFAEIKAERNKKKQWKKYVVDRSIKR